MELREIQDYPGYLVSDEGVVYGKRSSKKPLAGYIDKDGYHRVLLYNQEGRRKFFTHYLVARAFIGERPEGFHVNHKDLNKRNNHVSNLEYVTPGDNLRHYLRTDPNSCKGRPVSSLSQEEVMTILYMRRDGKKYREIAEHLGLKCRPDLISSALLHGKRISSMVPESFRSEIIPRGSRLKQAETGCP